MSDDKNKHIIFIISSEEPPSKRHNTGGGGSGNNSDSEYNPTDSENESSSRPSTPQVPLHELSKNNENLNSVGLPSISYQYNLNSELFNVKNLTDLIQLAQYYEPLMPNPFFYKLFNLIPPLVKLDTMVGMKNIKEQILKQVIYFIQDYHTSSVDGEFLNSVIYGSPGTGKTQVSYIIADIYRSLGYLKSNKVTFLKKSDLVGEYVGHSAPKALKALKACLGGVVVIDEVYSFGSGSEKGDSFAKEAVDVLNQFLSENKKEIACIVIGYKNDVEKCFFSINQGLARRFPMTLRYTIENYTPEELFEIFEYQTTRDGWKFNVDEYNLIKSEMINAFRIKQKYFHGNGGSTENLLNLIKNYQAIDNFGRIITWQNKYLINFHCVQKAIKHIINSIDSNKNNMEIDAEVLNSLYT